MKQQGANNKLSVKEIPLIRKNSEGANVFERLEAVGVLTFLLTFVLKKFVAKSTGTVPGGAVPMTVLGRVVDDYISRDKDA